MEVVDMKNIGEYIKKFKTYNRWFIENFYKVGLSDKEEADYLNEVFKENGIDLVVKASTIRSYRKSKDENGEYIHPELANLKFKRGRRKANKKEENVDTPKEEIKETIPSDENKNVTVEIVKKDNMQKIREDIQEITEEVNDDVLEEIFNDKIPKEEYPHVTVYQEELPNETDLIKEEENTPNEKEKSTTVMEINQNGIIQVIKNHNGLIKFEKNGDFEKAIKELKKSLGGDIMTVIDKYDIDCMELSIKQKEAF